MCIFTTLSPERNKLQSPENVENERVPVKESCQKYIVENHHYICTQQKMKVEKIPMEKCKLQHMREVSGGFCCIQIK